MTYQTIVLEECGSGSFRLTLNRPDKFNCFTEQMHHEIADALSRVEQASARALLITGAGRGFCAGQDLGERPVDAGPLDLGDNLDRYYNPLIRRLTSFRFPVLCAVNGAAAGAGVGIALACDIVVAKQSAKFAQAFSKIGLVPDAGASWHLTRIAGLSRAMGFTLLGETLSARQMQELGLIWRVIEDESFDHEVDAMLHKLATGPTFGLAAAKQAIRTAAGSSLDEALDLERDLQRLCGRSDDYREGVAAFKEKRTPHFTGK